MKRGLLFTGAALIAIAAFGVLSVSAYALVRPFTAKARAAAVAQEKLNSLGINGLLSVATFATDTDSYKTIFRGDRKQIVVYTHGDKATFVLGLPQ